MLLDPKRLSKAELVLNIERTSTVLFELQQEIASMKHQLEILERELERRSDLGIPR